jgi:hypothetical protein
LPVIEVTPPAGRGANIGSAPVTPVNTCPVSPTGMEVKAPKALPTRTAWLVVPDTLTVGLTVGTPVIVILLPPETEVTVPDPGPEEETSLVI